MKQTAFLALATAAALMYTTAASADTMVVVTPSNMDGWVFHITDPSVVYGAGDATAEMVSGPATPPLGTGSAHFDTGSDGFQSGQLRNSDWVGTALADLTALSYSTYASDWNGQQLPFLNLYLDTDNDNVWDDRLWFEPDYTSPAALNVWQTWDALNGQWYSDSHFGPGSNTDTLAAYLALEPTATIVNDGARGGIRIASGFASSSDHFDTNVDAFSIGTASGTTTYDFEPEAVPDFGSTAGMLAGALSLMTVLRRKLSR